MFTSQRFKDARTGEIVDHFNISEISNFDEYNGPLKAGDFDITRSRADVLDELGLVDATIKPEPLKVGDRVKVSNGQPKPPERFNRKLATWNCRNYTGTVKAIEAPSDYQPRGAIQIEPDGRSIPGVMSMVNHIQIGATNIERIEPEAPKFKEVEPGIHVAVF